MKLRMIASFWFLSYFIKMGESICLRHYPLFLLLREMPEIRFFFFFFRNLHFQGPLPGNFHLFALKQVVENLVRHIKIQGVWVIEIVLFDICDLRLVNWLIERVQWYDQHLEQAIVLNLVSDQIAKSSFPGSRTSPNSNKNSVDLKGALVTFMAWDIGEQIFTCVQIRTHLLCWLFVRKFFFLGRRGYNYQ